MAFYRKGFRRKAEHLPSQPGRRQKIASLFTAVLALISWEQISTAGCSGVPQLKYLGVPLSIRSCQPDPVKKKKIIKKPLHIPLEFKSLFHRSIPNYQETQPPFETLLACVWEGCWLIAQFKLQRVVSNGSLECLIGKLIVWLFV